MRLRRNRLLLKTLSLFTDADPDGEEVSPLVASAEPLSLESAPFRAEFSDYGHEDRGPEPAEQSPPDELSALYDELNDRYFDRILPPCELKWSRRLTRAAGTIRCERRLITLSVPLLVEPYREVGAAFEICGVTCASFEEALREILKHEMIHLWLYVQKLPHGHTPAFRAKARAIGQPRTRHNIALPPPTSGWVYRCAACASELHRRRRFSRPVACAACCKTHNRGKYDERFKLRGHRL